MSQSAIPELKPVESTNVSHIGYDADGRAAYVKFKSGGLYRYADVPQSAFDAFVAADSKGKHFSQSFAGKYQHTKVQ